MKDMKTRLLLLSVLILTLVSCKKSVQKPSSETPIVNEEVSLLDTLQLKLNHGEKWKANLETHVGIKNMDSIIKHFANQNTKDYVALGQLLSAQTSFVIKNCSMKGEPHDQLHVVLVPMLDEVSILKASESKDSAEAALSKLEDLIYNYFTHFKL